jgi:hypothetical protein
MYKKCRTVTFEMHSTLFYTFHSNLFWKLTNCCKESHNRYNIEYSQITFRCTSLNIKTKTSEINVSDQNRFTHTDIPTCICSKECSWENLHISIGVLYKIWDILDHSESKLKIIFKPGMYVSNNLYKTI